LNLSSESHLSVIVFVKILLLIGQMHAIWENTINGIIHEQGKLSVCD
jgi:hypothetical protein